MIPVFILSTWLLSLLSIGILAAAIFSIHEWQEHSWVWDVAGQESTFAPDLGANAETGLLALGVSLLFLCFMGRFVIKLFIRGKSSAKHDQETDPRTVLNPTSRRRIKRPDGSELNVEIYGSDDAPPIICTHGWGLNSSEWNYLKRDLSKHFRLIVWDLPGLGHSTRPSNRDYRLEKFASDLEAVLESIGPKPAILLGHSIGGMITLTFCRLFPEALGKNVSGLVLTHTTPINPLRTTSGAGFLTIIEKPILVPILYLTILFSPLLWLLNWLSFRNGSAHLMNKLIVFAGTETWRQVDFTTRFQLQASPAVLARGMLGMMGHDAIETLARITVPTLVVSGNKDSTTKPSASDYMQKSIPHAELVVLSPAKHMGLIEHHLEYAETVNRFGSSLIPVMEFDPRGRD